MKAFILDLDGVITDTADFHFQAWKKCAASINITLDSTFNEQLKGISRLESLERILRSAGRQDDFTAIEKEQLANEKNNFYKSLLLQLTPDYILPGIRQLLTDIKDAGYKLGLASASKNAPTVLRALEIDGIFDGIADPNNVTNGKPAPDLFLQAAAKLGVRPVECIAIEDAKSGIEAINEAGMFSVGVGDRAFVQEADFLTSSTNELSLHSLIKAWQRKNGPE
ncbi:beta-phosphoglucomutase [Ornithinibacillus californiensis]|uniref:beta-phosphoglucomutase n=1 Tax=Ornithinibacillus californiensis TaxID=161536 RepID=UPI00064DE119|nr:beta-phosphoglucomutase [Ornithinibacillus californiensis]